MSGLQAFCQRVRRHVFTLHVLKKRTFSLSIAYGNVGKKIGDLRYASATQIEVMMTES